MQTFFVNGKKDHIRVHYALSNLPDGIKYKIVIDEEKSTRSVEQNNRMWAILTDISEQVLDETGKQYSPETWHNFFKAKYLGKDTIIVDGEPILVEKTTTKLKIMEFIDYCTQIEAFAIDHGVKFHIDDTQANTYS